jgi:hypothetical protein
MKPIKFPEHNTVWAKDQTPYLPLPAYTDEQITVTRWSFSWLERFAVLFTGKMWLSQLNLGAPLQPQKPSIESPFESIPPAPDIQR